MDKTYQDVHYIAPKYDYKYVLRCVHILRIDMHGDYIKIRFERPSETIVAKIVGDKPKTMFFPKLDGAKLIID